MVSEFAALIITFGVLQKLTRACCRDVSNMYLFK